VPRPVSADIFENALSRAVAPPSARAQPFTVSSSEIARRSLPRSECHAGSNNYSPHDRPPVKKAMDAVPLWTGTGSRLLNALAAAHESKIPGDWWQEQALVFTPLHATGPYSHLVRWRRRLCDSAPTLAVTGPLATGCSGLPPQPPNSCAGCSRGSQPVRGSARRVDGITRWRRLALWRKYGPVRPAPGRSWWTRRTLWGGGRPVRAPPRHGVRRLIMGTFSKSWPVARFIAPGA